MKHVKNKEQTTNNYYLKWIFFISGLFSREAEKLKSGLNRSPVLLTVDSNRIAPGAFDIFCFLSTHFGRNILFLI